MKYESSPSRLHAAQADAFVVLIVSEAAKLPQNLETFSRVIKDSSKPVRLFISVSTEADVALAEAASRLGLSFEVLLSNEVSWEPIGGKSFRMPYAVKPETLDEIGLALTDGILVADDGKPACIVKRAGRLKKQLLEPSKPISHHMPVSPFELLRGLDPEEGVRNRILSSIVGRVEQGLLEALAVKKHGHPPSYSNSIKKLRECFGLKWRASSYFPPEDLNPDRSAPGPASPIAAMFDRMDRSALLGSRFQRDIIWLAHFGAALAVFAAVAGHVKLWPFAQGAGWGWVELVTLALVALFVWAVRGRQIQQRWMACRLCAEQLRIARMCLPVLILPPALQSEDRFDKHDLTVQAIALVKRACRNQGLPQFAGATTAQAAAKWIELIVKDQAAYHRLNFEKLETMEGRLNIITTILFGLAFAGVIFQLFVDFQLFADVKWLLLLTAAVPAFAAAVHGAGARLSIVHRSALSKEASETLGGIAGQLRDLIKSPRLEADAWAQVHQLAWDAAHAMGAENSSWHQLVRRQYIVLP